MHTPTQYHCHSVTEQMDNVLAAAAAQNLSEMGQW